LNELVKLISDLVGFRTTSDNPEEVKKCADYILSYLRGRGIIIKKYIKNDKISIVALFLETKKPKIFLNAHFDVVPASSHSFAPKILGDRLYGRGSDDCKAQVAALMLLMKDFAKQKRKPDIGIMLTSDEEVHGRDGVDYLLSEEGYGCEFALVADGGKNFDIVTKHKGVLQVRVSAIGKSAHSAYAWEGGQNAIDKLITAYAEIRKMFPSLKKPAWKISANLTKISGGDVLNKIPDYAELYLDIRRTEKDSEAAILKRLGGVEGVQVEKIAAAEMLETDESNPYVKKLRASAEKILKRKIKTNREHGATDARYFSARGMPAVLFKPLGADAHSESEHVVISSLQPYYEILIDFVKEAAK